MVASSRRSKSPAKSSPARKSPPARAKSPAKTSPARSAPAAPKPSTATYQLTLIYLACFLDYFAVALVVPNLVHRWKALGVSPEALGLVQSIYSGSQIVGGLLIGYLGDRGLGRKGVLLLSFAGAGVSYFLVGYADSVALLALSRVVVGLVKQTQTCSTALITAISSDGDRAKALGRLQSASTLAFVVGQSFGQLLIDNFGRSIPCYFAASLYIVDFAVVYALLQVPKAAAPPKKRAAAAAAKGGGRLGGVRSAFRGEGGRVLAFRLAYAFLMRGTYMGHALYEKERWGYSGYLASYKTVLGLFVNSLVVGPLAAAFPERALLLGALAVACLNSASEALHSSYIAYVAVNTLLATILSAVTRISLASLFSKSVPRESMGLVLGVFDVLSSACGVVAPLYGGIVTGRAGYGAQPLVAAGHFAVLTALATVLVPSPKGKAKNE